MAQSGSHHLGIDFGTSNSFLAISSEGVLSPNPVEFGNDGLRTLVLYRVEPPDGEKVLAFGDQAEHEWGMSTPSERATLRLASHFKPDIASHDPAPRKDAVAFLRCVVEDLTQRGALPSGKKPDQMDVLLGTPARTLNGFDETLRDIAAEAGLGRVELVKEPIGALVGHLSRKEFSVADARSGLMVIDFGGGTCDVAYVLRLEVRAAWGDPILGGRLFDDLFFRWFCDVNPDAAAAMAEQADTYYVHWIKCREMKERFSETMARDRGARFRFAIPPYGRLIDATWEAFVERARRYTPSEEFRALLAAFGPDYAALARDEPIDLLAWVRDVMIRGVGEDGIRLGEISYVILTGGSSAWPFVREMVAESLNIPAERILSSPSPRRAIGEGIALLPVLKRMHEQSVAEIRSEAPGKVYEILSEVRKLIDAFLQEMASELAARFVTEIEPALADFRKSGGRLRDLEMRITEQTPAIERRAEALIAERSGELAAKIDQRVTGILLPWFESKQIHWTPEKVRWAQEGRVSMQQLEVPVDNVYLTGLTTITSAVSALVMGSLFGGAGTALVAAGPGGWIAGAVTGAVLAVVFARGGRGYLVRVTQSIPIPAKLSGLALRRVRHEKIKEDLEQRLLEAFRPLVQTKETALRSQVSDIVQAQIDAVGALDHL